MTTIREWLQEASQREVVTRSLRVAAVVGTLLVAINHGDRVVSGEFDFGAFLKMGLT